MKFLNCFLLISLFGLSPAFAQNASAVINTSSCEKPVYPADSKRLNEEGTVQLRFLVGFDGKVIESQIEKSSGFRRLDEAARQALEKCQFKPALEGGVIQESWASMKYTWRLEIANPTNQCPPKLKLSGGYGCLSDYRFASKNDIETNREVAKVAAQSIGYVISAARETSCNSISIKSITTSNSGDDSVAKSLNACQKNGCECAVLINNGIVADQNLFSKYANYTAIGHASQPDSQQTKTELITNSSNLPACIGVQLSNWNNCVANFKAPNGNSYLGEFVDGRMHGKGICSYANGDKYSGDHKFGKANGNGEFIYADGRKFIGEFREDKRYGKGTEYSSNGAVVQRGIWLNDKFQSTVAIDASAPANNSSNVIFTSPQSASTKLALEERERLAVELAASNKKRQELEEQLRVVQQRPIASQSISSVSIGKRLALVVGNANYKVRPLKNSSNDADDVSFSLKANGFDVIDLRDATLPQMRTAVRQFGDRLINNDVGLVYYSGHGVEVKGRNYFIPVNADIQREDEIADQGLDVSLILEKMNTAGKGVNILIVDACRDDPFGRSFRSSSRGLAQMDAPRGTIIAYATSPGKVASDGDPRERNSPYTKHLVKAMQSPNKPIEQVFKEVRRAVQDETKNQQTPWENTSLSGDFFFRVQR